MKARIAALVTSLALTGCAGAAAHPPTARDWMRLAPGGHNDDLTISSVGRARGTVLVAHPGGFYLGNPETSRWLSEYLARHGYDVIDLDYPMRDYAAARRYVQVAAAAAGRRPGPLFMVGESAGGALAVDAAARGEVTAAVAVGAPSDFADWRSDNRGFWTRTMRMSHRQRVAESPAAAYRRRPMRRAPLLLCHSPEDREVPYRESRTLARMPGVTLMALTGQHLDDKSYRPRMLRWLAARS